eukprot:31197-Pelagococcus_subviridis.AAC.29
MIVCRLSACACGGSDRRARGDGWIVRRCRTTARFGRARSGGRRAVAGSLSGFPRARERAPS